MHIKMSLKSYALIITEENLEAARMILPEFFGWPWACVHRIGGVAVINHSQKVKLDHHGDFTLIFENKWMTMDDFTDLYVFKNQWYQPGFPDHFTEVVKIRE